MSSSKLILLRSSDGETFEVDENVAMVSLTIKHMIDDDCADSVIPLPNVSSKVLSKVIEYCKKHMETPTPKADDKGKEVVEEDSKTKKDDKLSEEELKAFDKEFVDEDEGTLFDYILAANYLNIKTLLDLTCQNVADNIKHKSPEEIRKLFNIKNDFTPEEEAEVRKENAWAFD